jgi:hypothetical protein
MKENGFDFYPGEIWNKSYDLYRQKGSQRQLVLKLPKK